MIYQLPSGKVISLSIEQFLELTEEDIDYLISINFGNYANTPWYGSAIKSKVPPDNTDIDTTIDFKDDDEEISSMGPNIIFFDDMDDLSDVDFSQMEE